MPTAYACLISEANLGAIQSEHPKFDLTYTKNWLKEHGDKGYFLRDPSSSFDCHYFDEQVFFELYRFADPADIQQLFRRVEKV